MTSSIDYIDCPICGNQVEIEQDHKTGKTYFGCHCGYNGDNNINPRMIKYKIQQYMEDIGIEELIDLYNHICIAFPLINRKLEYDDVQD